MLTLLSLGKILQDDKTIDTYNIEEKGFIVCMVSKVCFSSCIHVASPNSTTLSSPKLPPPLLHRHKLPRRLQGLLLPPRQLPPPPLPLRPLPLKRLPQLRPRPLQAPLKPRLTPRLSMIHRRFLLAPRANQLSLKWRAWGSRGTTLTVP